MVELQPAWRSFASIGTLISGVLGVAIWGLLYGWEAGAWLVLLLYLHEAGHVLVAQWRRLPVTQAPIFVPGLGAFVMVGGEQRPWDAALLAMGGPAVGGAAALVAKLVGLVFDLPVLAFVGDFGLWLNVLNLIPVPGLDGGRVGRLSGMFVLGTAGLVGSVAMWFGMRWPMIASIVGAITLVGRSPNENDAPRSSRLGIALCHVLVLGGVFGAYVLSPSRTMGAGSDRRIGRTGGPPN